jgi:hypothetical protein
VFIDLLLTGEDVDDVLVPEGDVDYEKYRDENEEDYVAYY